MMVTVAGPPNSEPAPGTWQNIQRMAGWLDRSSPCTNGLRSSSSGRGPLFGLRPDVLGCIATGSTIGQTVARLTAALQHLAALRDHDLPLPVPTTTPRDATPYSPADYITTIEVEAPDRAPQPVSLTA
jgi:hypothetical protein